MRLTWFCRFTVAFEGSASGPPEVKDDAADQITDYLIQEDAGRWKVWEDDQPVSLRPEQHVELGRLLRALSPLPDERTPPPPWHWGGDDIRYGMEVRQPGLRRGYTWGSHDTRTRPAPEWASLVEVVEYVRDLVEAPRRALAEQHRIVATHFFDRLLARDVEGAMECCGPHIEYSNPFFHGAHARRGAESVASMWRAWFQMLPDVSLVCDDIGAGHEHAFALWTAQYTFPNSRKRVQQRINSHLEFTQGKITRHRDNFGLYEWGRQVGGVAGSDLSWLSPFRQWIASRERARLAAFDLPPSGARD